MRVGFVGTGQMGIEIVKRLSLAGVDPFVVDRSGKLTGELTEAGIRSSSSAIEVARESDVVYICVLTDQQVKDAALSETGIIAEIPAGGVIIVHTTCDPQTLEAIAREAAMKGIRVVDAALSGGPADIKAGRLTLFIGATSEDLEYVRPLLITYAEVIVPAGAVGYGQRVKLINNALFTAHIGLAADALRLGREIGVSEQVLLAALPHASGNSRAVQIIAASGSLDRSVAAVGRFVAKDVRVVQEVAARLDADLGVLGQVIDSPFIHDEIMKY
ncbi:MAG: NAD(P)-dependent oxidoreductase [Actinomycetota bacterium]|nr:NAD(P)-dependent oxidoreductase [Actinomycetota bacterium]MDP2287627.1 NAD(P)-dependent oxidoreductase [Actinomycetota bacterium]